MILIHLRLAMPLPLLYVAREMLDFMSVESLEHLWNADTLY